MPSHRTVIGPTGDGDKMISVVLAVMGIHWVGGSWGAEVCGPCAKTVWTRSRTNKVTKAELPISYLPGDEVGWSKSMYAARQTQGGIVPPEREEKNSTESPLIHAKMFGARHLRRGASL